MRPGGCWVVIAAMGAIAAGHQDITRGPAPERLRLHQLTSRVFGNTRTLRVLVPTQYDAPGQAGHTYPVLYLNDGQNLFDAATSVFTGQEWRVDDTLDALTASGDVPPMIVVGIDNAGRRGRAREYLPFPDAFLDPPEPDPQGARYPEFLVSEVMPFVDARYRTAAGAAGRGIGGSSYGALAALFAVTERPGVFGRLLLESPSLYVDGGAILKLAQRVSRWPDRVYVGVGTHEVGAGACDAAKPGDGGEAVRDVRRLAAILRRAGVDDERLRIVIAPCATHDERAWASRLPAALRFLYAAPPLRSVQ